MEQQILTTKFFVPTARPELVSRPRLLARLNSGLRSKLILISAPAGYGKTTLVTDWLHLLEPEDKPQIGWLSLDEDDRDPQQFFRYLAEVIRPLPDAQPSLAQLLQSNQPFPAKVLMKTFIQDVTAVSTPFILVLDDYHVLDSGPIDEAMTALLERMPAQMTLVMTTRNDPGFPISRMRASGDLVELRADDLRFSGEEATEFLLERMKLSLPPEQISALETRTEGWIAGLQMAALSMQNRMGSDLEGFVQGLTGSHRFILDYLTDEVLSQIPGELQTFLLETSVLHRLNAELCDAILPQGEAGQSKQYLEKLEASNSFIIALDDDRRWFRYHHLFGDLLRQKLPASEGQQARRKAAIWCAQHDLTSDAIEYALEAEAWDIATPLLVKHGLQFVFQGKLRTLQRWLDTLPRELLLQQPRMCLDYAWVLVNKGEKKAVEPYLQAAEAAAQGAPETRAITALIRANNARAWEDEPVMESEAELTLKLTPSDNKLARCTALLQLGVAQVLCDHCDLPTAISTLQEASALARECRNMNTAFLSGGYLGCAQVLDGDPAQAALTLNDTLAFASETGLEQSPLLVHVHLGLGHLAYLNEDWAAARQHLEFAQANGLGSEEVGAQYRASLLLALVELADGNQAAARQALEDAAAAATGLNNPETGQHLQLLEQVVTLPKPQAAALEWVRLLATGASMARAREHSQAAGPDQDALVNPLSERELEILALVADGLKNQEIAEKMIISLNTVLYHTKNIYSKLGVNTRSQAIAKARQLNLL